MSELETIKALEERINSVRTLADSNAFKLFLAAFESSRQSAFAKATKTEDPHVAMKHLAAYSAWTDLTTWCERQIMADTATLQSMKGAR